MNKIVLLLIILVGVFADWELFGSTKAVDKNGYRIFPKASVFVEYNKINAKNNYDGYIFAFGVAEEKGGGFTVRYIHLKTNIKDIEKGIDYYAMGLDSGRSYMQKVGLTWMLGSFYGNQYKQIKGGILDNSTLGIYLGTGVKWDIITDTLSIKAESAFYAGIIGTFTSRIITSYGIVYLF